jgi:NH3-dependent NAD+ synthetase
MKNTSNISDYEEKFKQKLDAYAKDYRVEELNQSNDKAQLRMLISAELMLEAIEKEIQNIIAS